MANRKLAGLTSSLVLLIAAAALGFPPHRPALEGEARGPQRAAPHAGVVVGTWRVLVTLVNCQTGQALGAPFPSLLTFAQGGTITETTANAAFFPAVRGPGHGVWNAEGGRSYRASTTAFITKDGALVRNQTITQEIEVTESDDAFFSTASVVFTDPAGALLAKGCATATGERFR